MVRFGTDSCASEGKESKPPPPPLRPCRCHSRGYFPRLTSVRKQFWDFSRKFPEIFRNISNIFRYFVRPLFIGVSRPSEAFSLLFRTFFVTFRTFFGTFRTFSVTFRAFSVTSFSPVPVTRSDHCVTIPGTLNVAEPQPVVSQRGTFHQCSVGPPQNKRL